MNQTSNDSLLELASQSALDQFAKVAVSSSILNYASDQAMHPVACADGQRKWYQYITASVITFLAGLVPMLLTLQFQRFIAYRKEKRKRKLTNPPPPENSPQRSIKQTKMDEVQQYMETLISGQNFLGRVLTIAILILSCASFIIYNLEASDGQTKIERCVDDWFAEPMLRLDLFLNTIFAVHFVLRFLAARNKLHFWLDGFSMVDFLTIPPILVGFATQRVWSGLRFLRIAYFVNLPDVLQIIDVLRTGQLIRLCKVITRFLVMWLICAGFVHLVESYGDVWRLPWNGRATTYWECFYFLIVTSSTVGYGDITCHTVVGRAFCVVFIFVALSTFANALPEFYAIANLRNPYGGKFILPKGKKHVVICGYITLNSATAFLNDFLHPDRKIDNVIVVFLNQEMPNLEMESLLKRHGAQAQYLCGDEMVASDLDRVDVKHAETCIILVDKLASDPDAEDAGNIMRVISIKNYCASTRIIVQLLLYQNKAYLLNIPGWSTEQHFDDAVCLSELKLGFLAQNCLAPGFSTLLSLLFMPISSSESDTDDPLKLAYLRGAGMEIYGEMLSEDFIGYTFADVAELCYRKLNLVLFALNRVDEPYENVIINPGKSFVIPRRTQGFFIAESAEHASKAFYYCRRCHAHIGELEMIGRCLCRRGRENNRIEPWRKNTRRTSRVDRSRSISKGGHFRVNTLLKLVTRNRKHKPPRPKGTSYEGERIIDMAMMHDDQGMVDRLSAHNDVCSTPGHRTKREHVQMRHSDTKSSTAHFDYTGMFHWCPKQHINRIVLTVEEATQKNFKNHIVVCVFGHADSPLVGLVNFVMPLRSSNYNTFELKPIVFIGQFDYMQREWETMNTFPKCYLLPGSPLVRANLRAANVQYSDMCVILTARQKSLNIFDTLVIDKEVILCCLNIKSMRFSDTDDSSTITDAYTRSVRLSTLSVTDKRKHRKASMALSYQSEPQSECSCHPVSHLIPTIMELSQDSNVQFLDQDDDDDPDVPLYLTQPFQSGNAFTVSLLDSLMTTAFYNKDALSLIRALVTGGSTPELEQILSEGLGFCPSIHSPEAVANLRRRPRVTELPLTNGPLSLLPLDEATPYSTLFLYALQVHNIICLGIYRLPQESQNGKRYVIVNPEPTFKILKTDRFICLQPFDPDISTAEI